jgi:hypothetical protein
LGLAAEWEYQIPGSRKSYDIFLPASKTAIEYHGLYWHSELRSSNPKRDYEKYLQSVVDGVRLLQIYQDEWRDHPNLLLDLIHKTEKAKRCKPVFSVLPKLSKQGIHFLDTNHYLGSSGGCLVVEATLATQVVGIWVFKKVSATRVEWVRACWDRTYKAWNPHSSALLLAIPELQRQGFTEIVSFSDNRLHTGDLYQQLGFHYSGEVKPGYYYTNGYLRRSRQKFMVKAGNDERAKAAEQGWYRIWDSGKKRWVMKIKERSYLLEPLEVAGA